jgi:hypothetical protein
MFAGRNFITTNNAIPIPIQLLLVGGGASGGYTGPGGNVGYSVNSAGGGGAGGAVSYNINAARNTNYSLGVGGAGDNSTGFGFTAYAGGSANTSNGGSGYSGGCGGGGGAGFSSGGFGVQGGNGADGSGTTTIAGGGGGASSNGVNSSGGTGINDFLGNYIAVGGNGGNGTGGDGASATTYGSGGGGGLESPYVGCCQWSCTNSGSGYQGCVQIKYLSSYGPPKNITGSYTLTISGGYRIYVFSGSGSIQF